MSATHPLMLDHPAPLARVADRDISRRAFLADVHALAGQLPEASAGFNLCTDRYHFAVAFAALVLRGQINLLPPNRCRTTLAELAARFPDAHALVDSADVEIAAPCRWVDAAGLRTPETGTVPEIPLDQTAVLAFSSGSTGHPTAHARHWGALVAVTRQARARFDLDRDPGQTLVATVPPQHMYGLESTVLYALLGYSRLLADCPFYPGDIHAALAEAGQATLVTTPFHLNTCLRSPLDWPATRRILCATAPLDPNLAARAETGFHAPLREIYGCTEAGAIASREPTRDTTWMTYDGVILERDPATGLARAQGPQHPDAVLLPDHIEPLDERHFRMQGRLADQLNIAGKRASLAELNQRLNAIPGVEDGVFLAPAADPRSSHVQRLAALVVAPGLSEQEILTRLAESIDAVFLPRPLVRIEELPRTATGKLPRERLLDLLATQGECA